MMKFEECENHYGACQSGQNAPGITVFLPNQRTKVTLVTKRLMYFNCTPNIQNSRNGAITQRKFIFQVLFLPVVVEFSWNSEYGLMLFLIECLLGNRGYVVDLE